LFIPIDATNQHAPYERGDVVLIPQAILLTPAELPPGASDNEAASQLGDVAGVRRRLWDEQADPAHAAWAHVTFGPAVILPPGCAIDKDYTVLCNRYLRKAKTLTEQDAAEQKAAAEADKVLQVASLAPDVTEPGVTRAKFVLDDGSSAIVAARYVPAGSDAPPSIAKPR
jgi:hypothetical protein